MNNAFYGKTLQSPRNKKRIKTALTQEQCKKYLSDPCVTNFQIINDNFAVFQLNPIELYLNIPIYVGVVVLEASKRHIYETYYDIFKSRYGENIKLLYTDTDSLIFELTCDNLINELKQLENIFDFSNYPKSHPLYSEKNKQKLGLFKDETQSQAISEFVGL